MATTLSKEKVLEVLRAEVFTQQDSKSPELISENQLRSQLYNAYSAKHPAFSSYPKSTLLTKVLDELVSAKKIQLVGVVQDGRTYKFAACLKDGETLTAFDTRVAKLTKEKEKEAKEITALYTAVHKLDKKGLKLEAEQEKVAEVIWKVIETGEFKHESLTDQEKENIEHLHKELQKLLDTHHEHLKELDSVEALANDYQYATTHIQQLEQSTWSPEEMALRTNFAEILERKRVHYQQQLQKKEDAEVPDDHEIWEKTKNKKKFPLLAQLHEQYQELETALKELEAETEQRLAKLTTKEIRPARHLVSTEALAPHAKEANEIEL